MDNLSKNLKSMPDVEPPNGLHKKIINDLIFLKFKVALLAAVILLPLNLIFLGWHLWESAIETEAYTLISSTLNDFELSYDFFANFVQTINDAIPIYLIVAFLMNLLLVIYMLIHFRSVLKQLSFKHR